MEVQAFAHTLDLLRGQQLGKGCGLSGSGRNLVAGALINFLLKLEMAVCASPWYSRVPTPSNISDEPSRGEIRTLSDMGAHQSDAETVPNQIMEVLAESAIKVG